VSFRHLVLLCVAVATTISIVVAQGSPANNFNVILGEELPSLTRNVIADPNIGMSAETSPELTEPPEIVPVAINSSSPEIPPLEIPVPPPRNDRPPTTVPSVPPIRTPSGDNIPAGAINHAGRSLTPTERSRIATFLQSKGISLFSPFAPPNSARFILHDTAGILPQSFLDRERRENRGPLGLGVSIYAPRNNEGVVARPNFYEMRRPTTTLFEKAEDILSQSTREGYFRRIWRSAKPGVRQDALDSALNGLGLTETEMSSERRKATQQLNSNTNEKIYTTATWAAEKICDRYNGDRSIAFTGDLEVACRATANYFRTRNQRVSESVPIEILQVGTRSQSGNQNSCTASNSNLQPLPNPPYSQTQYDTTIVQYLRSAAIAGKYPEITTHYALDTFAADAHCDPRCFNVNKVYTSIADLMGHDRGSKYGITPSYGTRLGRNNIWWNDRVCYSAPPQ
jgi:hypothetical protein